MSELFEFCHEGPKTVEELEGRFPALSPHTIGFILGILYQRGHMCINRGFPRTYLAHENNMTNQLNHFPIDN